MLYPLRSRDCRHHRRGDAVRHRGRPQPLRRSTSLMPSPPFGPTLAVTVDAAPCLPPTLETPMQPLSQYDLYLNFFVAV